MTKTKTEIYNGITFILKDIPEWSSLYKPGDIVTVYPIKITRKHPPQKYSKEHIAAMLKDGLDLEILAATLADSKIMSRRSMAKYMSEHILGSHHLRE